MCESVCVWGGGFFASQEHVGKKETLDLYLLIK